MTARVQYRTGPPLTQPFRDLLKLRRKETLIPVGAAPAVFLGAPLIGLAGVTVAGAILWSAILLPGDGYLGDLVVVLYLLTLPSLAIMLGGFASANPLASLGGAREMKLLLACELPFLIVLLVPVIHAGYEIRLGALLSAQAESGAMATHLSGALALLVGALWMQAKLGLVPFDLAEAETEIGGGALIDYGGPPLAVYRLSHAMLLAVAPLFLIVLFLGGAPPTLVGFAGGLVKFAALIALSTVIRNTNPRLRIDQALRLFWGPITALAVAAVLLALGGW